MFLFVVFTESWPGNRVSTARRYLHPLQEADVPALPARRTQKEVYDTMEDVNCAPHIQPVFDYLRSTWLESDLWTVEYWSVFGQTHSTNNDLEEVAPPIYRLLDILFWEAKDVDIQ